MRKYFVYELKKNLPLIVIACIFVSALYVVSVLSADLKAVVLDRNHEYFIIPDSLIHLPIYALIGFCGVVPIHMFRFKMSARETDCIYSMSISRQKIYFARSLVGLIMVFAPFTLCYWTGFAATVVKADMYDFGKFVPAFFYSFGLGIMLFGLVSFAFTRANHIVDGLILIAAYVCIAVMVSYFVNQILWLIGKQQSGIKLDFSYWFAFSPLITLAGQYNNLIIGNDAFISPYIWMVYLLPFVSGTAAWLGFLLTAKKEKAENTGRISDSLFGYRIMIPAYLTLALSLAMVISNSMVLLTIFLILAILITMIFRRTTKLKYHDYLSLTVSIVAAVALSIVIWAI